MTTLYAGPEPLRNTRPAADETEVKRLFALRANRAQPGQAKAILARSGLGNPPRDEDRLDIDPSK